MAVHSTRGALASTLSPGKGHWVESEMYVPASQTRCADSGTVIPDFLSLRVLKRRPSSQSMRAPAGGEEADRALLTRVIDLRTNPREFHVRQAGSDGSSHYFLAIPLRTAEISAYRNGRLFFDGKTRPGMAHIVLPKSSMRIVVRSPSEVLLLLLPSRLVEHEIECAPRNPAFIVQNMLFDHDPSVATLARELADELAAGTDVNRLYTEGICTAIVARLLRNWCAASAAPAPSSAALSTWRIKQVWEYIQAHLADPISSSDLANVAGLSRMHFAAQFKRACGYRPHEYLMKQRVERAKRLLLTSDSSVIDVAFHVGFESQSHFASVFKRMVGSSPSRWRSFHRR